MELRHLRYFAAVAETRHFGRAAEQLHLAQPALSQSIRQLEKELGVSLFTRTTRQVSLTPAGEFLRVEAQRILGAVEDSIHGVRRIAEGHHGLVRIAFTGTAAYTELPRIARLVQEHLPGIALDIRADLLTPTQTAGLLDGSIDLGVLRPPVSAEGIRVRTIADEPLVLAVPADHALAVLDPFAPPVTMGDLRTESFVVYSEEQSAVNDAVQRSCIEAGFVLRRAHEAPGTAALLALVAAGLGVGLVPASVRAAPLGGVVFRDVVDSATVELACAWRDDDASPMLHQVIDTLEAAGVFADSPVHDPAPRPHEVTR